MSVAGVKLRRGTNDGRGWVFQFADGHRCWMLGASAAEIRALRRRHGDLVAQEPA